MKKTMIDYLITGHLNAVAYFGDEPLISWLENGFKGYYQYSLAELVEEYNHEKGINAKNRRQKLKKFQKIIAENMRQIRKNPIFPFFHHKRCQWSPDLDKR